MSPLRSRSPRQKPEPVSAAAYAALFEPGRRPENTFVRYLIPAVDGPVNQVTTEVPDPRTNSEHLMEVCHWVEADRASIIRFSSDLWVRGAEADNVPTYAISLLKRTTARGSRAILTTAQLQQLADTELALIACMIANYIRELGFPARAHHVAETQVVADAVAVAGGLGSMDRSGRFESHGDGAAVSLATVTTDMPLVPLTGPLRRHRRLSMPDMVRARR